MSSTYSINSGLLFCGAIIFGELLSTAAGAQSRPPDAGLELQQQQRQRQEYRRALPSSVLEESVVEEHQPKSASSETLLYVEAYTFSGAVGSIATKEKLATLVADFAQQKLSISQLNQVTSTVTDYLRSNGYITSRAVLLPQDASGGIIDIQIVEGKIDTLDGILVNDTRRRLKEGVAEKVLSNALKPNAAVRRQSIERGVLLLRDLPGVSASANLESGSQPNTTRLLLDTSEGEFLSPGLSVSNAGSRLTGEYESVLSLGMNNATGYGDQVFMSIQETFSAGANRYIYTQAKIPVGYSGLKLGGIVHYLDFKVGKEFEQLDSNGTALQMGVNMEYPIVRSSANNLFVNVGVEYKKLRDHALGQLTNHRDLKALNIGMFANKVDEFFGGGYIEGSLKLSYGDLDLKGLDISYQSDQSPFGAKTDGNYTKLALVARRFQQLSDKTGLLFNLTGQIASGNLSTSEKMQLGGPNGVRAYPSGAGAGDAAVLANVEAQYALLEGTRVGDVRLSGFYDWGRTRQYENAENLALSSPNMYNISGYGVSLSMSESTKYNAKLTLARRIGSNPARDTFSGKDYDGSLEKTRLWLSVDFRF